MFKKFLMILELFILLMMTTLMIFVSLKKSEIQKGDIFYYQFFPKNPCRGLNLYLSNLSYTLRWTFVLKLPTFLTYVLGLLFDNLVRLIIGLFEIPIQLYYM